MNQLENTNFALGDWIVEPAIGQIRNGEDIHVLRPGLMTVLVFLAQRPNEIVSAQDIINGPWNGITIADSSVYRAISDLRKLLGDNDPVRVYIKTIPRRGYQLIASVERLAPPTHATRAERLEETFQSPAPEASAKDQNKEEGTGPLYQLARHRLTLLSALAIIIFIAVIFLPRLLVSPEDGADSTGAAGRISDVSIAVIPFHNLSGDPRQEYLSDGISSELLNLLAQIEGLRVSARRSSFAYKNSDLSVQEIARRLNVQTILEGSLRQVGPTLRVTAQLVDVETGFNVWSRSFQSDLKDVLLVEDKISAEIMLALKPHLGKSGTLAPQTRKTSLEVFDAYLLGQHYFNQSNRHALAKSLAHFDQAISLDPGYAPAYVGKANTYLLLSEDLYGNIPAEDVIFGATILINKALAIDPDLASAVVAKGQLFYRASRFDKARFEFDKAVALDASLAEAYYWQGRTLLRQFEIGQAAKALAHAHDLDPLTMAPFINLIQALALMGRFEDADGIIDRFQTLAPEEPSTIAHTIVALSQGNLAEAYLSAREAVATNNYAQYRRELSLTLLELRQTEEAFDLAPNDNPLYSNQTILDEAKSVGPFDFLDRRAGGEDVWLKSAITEFSNRNFFDSANYFELAINGNEAIDGPLFALLPERIRAPYLAYAWQRSGNHGRAVQLITTIEEALDRYRQNGATASHLILEARLQVLKGNNDEALAALVEAHRTQKLSWYALQEPFFDAMRSREEFKALVKDVDNHINEERKKLGWDPL